MGKVLVLVIAVVALAGGPSGAARGAGRPGAGVKRYQVTATVGAGTMPTGVAVNSRSGKVRVGRLPTGLAANSSTGRLYVANQNGGNVSILSPIKGS